MAFKMTGWSAGKGTGSAKGLPKKTHLRYTPQTQINRGKEFYEGENPYGDLHVDMDDSMYWDKMHSDKDYISMDMTAEEKGSKGPGEDIERGSGRGSVTSTSEKHEGYRGVKDEGAGYNKFTLGQRNEQEKQDNQRFNKDLNKNLKNYKSKLPISGDWKMDDKTFDYWKNITKASGSDSDLRKMFEDDVTDSLNLDNELKLATEAGYKPDSVALRDADPSISLEEGDYKLNEGKYKAHQENKDLRQVAAANRKADDAMSDAIEHTEKHGGTVADYFDARPNKRDDVQGKHSFGQVDVDTQGFYDDAMYADMSKKEKKEYDKQKDKEKQERVQLESDIQENLPQLPSIMGSEGSEYEGMTKREKRKAKREAMFADAYDPQSSAMSKKPVFGTDEYYDFMKKKRTKEMGLTKRMFNIYDKD
jgi:hypothetical protein